MPINQTGEIIMGRKFEFEFTSFTFEQLKEMTQQELQQQLIKFKRMIKEANNAGKDTLPFETEYCYLDHEKQMRYRDQRRSR